MSNKKTLSKVQHLIVYDDGSVSAPDSSWQDAHCKERVVQLILRNNHGCVSILERQNNQEQFFQLWDGEKIFGQDFNKVKSTIGKVINDDGDCVIVEYCCKSHCFKTKMDNIYTVGMMGGPINFEMLGIKGFPQNREE